MLCSSCVCVPRTTVKSLTSRFELPLWLFSCIVRFVRTIFSSCMRMSSRRLPCLPDAFFSLSRTPQGLQSLRISDCVPPWMIRTAVVIACASSVCCNANSVKMSSIDILASISTAMCSVAAWPVGSLVSTTIGSTGICIGSEDALDWESSESWLSARDSVAASPVSSVTGLDVVARFLGAFLRSCALLPKVGSSRAMKVHALSIRTACIHIAVRIRHVTGGTCQSNNASKSVNRAMPMVDISWNEGPVNAIHQQWSGSQ